VGIITLCGLGGLPLPRAGTLALTAAYNTGTHIQHADGGMMVHKLHVSSPYNVNTSLQKPYNTCVVTCKFELIKLIASTANNHEMLCHERLSN